MENAVLRDINATIVSIDDDNTTESNDFMYNMVVETVPEQDMLDLQVNKTLIQFFFKGTPIDKILQDQDEYLFSLQNNNIMNIQMKPEEATPQGLKVCFHHAALSSFTCT